MTTIACHEIINTHFAKPVFKSWEPSEYDMKYKYNTSRRAKKLDADREKMNAKLQVPFQKRLNSWNTVHQQIDEIATYPKEIADLFLNTFSWTISDLVRRHEAHLAVRQQIIDEYGEEIFKLCYNYLLSDMRSCSFSRTEPHLLSNEKFREIAKSRRYGVNFHKLNEDTWDYDYPMTTVADPRHLMELCITYYHARKNDEVNNLGDEAYVSAIIHMSETLSRILLDINHCFDGNKPTECLTDASWGAKGEFNGILTDGHKKISFKSFGAGGYNIQRFHYRFKITELKR